MVMAPFIEGETYNLSLRLEYGPQDVPSVFHCDFNQIHPKSYTASVDFSSWSLRGAMVGVGLGDDTISFTNTRACRHQLDSGLQIAYAVTGEHCHLQASIQSNMPYAHRHFPAFHLGL
mgnify:CR=1 FL=1